MAKRLFGVLFLVLLAGVTFAAGIGEAIASQSMEHASFENQYINLQGEWHFKLYRKYQKMFQYFNYGGCAVTWENLQDAQVPTAEIFNTWETVNGPNADYATGGLQQMNRANAMTAPDDRTRLTEADLFPKWSEAWFCKTITIPEGFLVGDTVTLMLGIIDDLDVVYINGSPVGASGFKASNGSPASPADVPEAGGFAPAGEFQFEKSYWEVLREYVVDARLLHEGENELSIRLYNNNSYGGFYDRTMALVSTPESLRFLKGQPTEKLANTTRYATFVEAQKAAIENEDLDRYAATLSASYTQNELDKTEQLQTTTQMFADYDNIQIADTDAGYYRYNGSDVYSAKRTVTGERDGKRMAISSDDNYLLYLLDEAGTIRERGNWSHCYTVNYISSLAGMNNTKQTYSVYLPPSYYESPTRSYPVVYLLHGINSTGNSFVNVDRIEARMNEWIAAGSVTEMIVVMPNAGKSSGYVDSDAPKGPSDTAGPWASFIYVDILGEVECNYRAIADARFRGISGISMGGGGVFSVGLAHPDIYTSFASHMGAVPQLPQYFEKIDAKLLETLDFYLDCGNQDLMVRPSATVEAGTYLESIGANVQWEMRDGGHNSAFYMDGMPKSMAMHSQHFINNGLATYK